MVLNTHFGGPELLPFDLRMRRAVTYEMPEKAEDRAGERVALEKKLEAALRAIFGSVTSTTGEEIRPLPVVEQLRKAVQEEKPNQRALARRYFTSFIDRLDAMAPKYSDTEPPDETLVRAIDAAVPLIVLLPKNPTSG